MSCGDAYSSLYVICKDEAQKRELKARFELEPPLDDFYYLAEWGQNKLKVNLELNTSEVCSGFDDEILSFAQWLKEKFDLELQGFWEYETDGNHWRCEVHDGQVKDAGLDWLAGYTVEQIEELRKYAEENFKNEEI